MPKPRNDIALIRAVQAGDKDATRRLIQENIKLLYWCIGKAFGMPAKTALRDLYLGEAAIHFVYCVERFRPEFGTQLITYCAKAIIHHLHHVQIRERCPVVPNMGVFNEPDKAKRSTQFSALRALRSRDWSPLPQHDGTTPRHLWNGQEYVQRPRDVDGWPEWFDRDAAERVFASLPWQDRDCLSRMCQGESLDDIAISLGVSRQRIHQRITRAVNRLRYVADCRHAAFFTRRLQRLVRAA